MKQSHNEAIFDNMLRESRHEITFFKFKSAGGTAFNGGDGATGIRHSGLPGKETGIADGGEFALGALSQGA